MLLAKIDLILSRLDAKKKGNTHHIIHWCCRLEELLKTSPLVQLGSTLYLPQILSQKSRKKSRSSCKPVKLEMTGPNESGSFIIYFATPMKVCYQQASYQIVNLVTISLEQAFFLGHHQTNMTIILMLRIIPSNIITAPNGLTQNVLRKRGPLTKPWVMTHDIPWHSKYSLSNISLTPSKTCVDGCGFSTRLDLETAEPVKDESPSETSENDPSNYICRRDEVIEESDIAGFETLEN